MGDASRVTLQVEDGLARLRLTRAAKRNAIDDAFLDEFAVALDAIEKDAAVTVVLIEADGPSFCAGFDLDVLARFDTEAERTRQFATVMRARLRKLSRVLDRLWSLEPVTLAVVQGAAAGGGFSLILACDLRILASDARCWYPEVGLGSPLTPASTRLLTRLVPAGVARDIILSCRRLEAPELASLGIANRVSDPATLAGDARAYADDLLAKPPRALLTSKATINALVAGETVLRADLLRGWD